ncbi:MAG: hypothetical protein ACK4I8_06910, partial [Armatimonadota bacterium]
FLLVVVKILTYPPMSIGKIHEFEGSFWIFVELVLLAAVKLDGALNFLHHNLSTLALPSFRSTLNLSR